MHLSLVRAFALSSLCVAVAGSTAACSEVKRPDGGSGLVPVGSPAPDVTGEDPAGHEVRVSANRGKAVVVYFYPADGTPGCTKEACAFRDAWAKLDQAGVVVLGVSSNSAESHRKFQKEHQLPFALASDENGLIANSYGVSKKLWGYDRVSLLVGKDGRIAKIWPSVDPGVHAREVIEESAKLP
jgi:peroxiredoxin Q/BCP